ncbi:Gfo/Idh/MocA family protein [Nitrospira sp. Nam74]
MPQRRVRYAVVGLGHIAQVAVLPAFAHAAQNSQVTALVSGNRTKLKQISKRYGIPHTYSYRDYDRCLNDGHVDAVYIALPNSMHCEYTVRAARAGIHVLCEKPMAVTSEECRQMIQAAKQARVKLMVAYRLHFEEANMTAVDLIRSRKLGPVRFFNSVFTMQVRPGDIRVKREYGGGTLYDIGVYCINAARYLFGENPEEVTAFVISGADRRFKEVDEMTGALLRFPQDRLGTFVCSFGATDVSAYEVVGTKGRIRVEPAYEYVGKLKQQITINGKPRERAFPSRDQFAPELLYFSECILRDRDPEPSGEEGLNDIRIIEALYRSAEIGRPVKITGLSANRRPTSEQIIKRPPVKKPSLVQVRSPSL